MQTQTGVWDLEANDITQDKIDLNKDHRRHAWEKELVPFQFALTMASGTKKCLEEHDGWSIT